MIKETVQPEFVINELFVRGSMALLSGSPKVGKSVFCLEAAAAVADGLPFLHQFRASPGVVLFWLADDPNENKFTIDFQKLGIKHPENFILWPERRKLDTGGLVSFNAMLEELRPALTIIDNLTCVRPRRAGAGDVAQDDYDQSRLLLELAVRHNTAMIVLHHKATGRKMGDAFDSIAGSFGVGAGSGDSLLLDRIEHGRTERYVRGQGRNLGDMEFIYARDSNGRLFFVARGPCCRHWDKLIYPIAVRDENSFDVEDVANETGAGRRWAYAMLQDLRRCGAAEALGGGRYRLEGGLVDAALKVRNQAALQTPDIPH